MDYKQFYAALFAPLAATFGPIDKHTIFHIMGFDGGGPVNLSTIGIDIGTPSGHLHFVRVGPTTRASSHRQGRLPV